MKKIIILLVSLAGFNSCNYLDIVPDNVATLENAFTMRNTAERFLFTCYSYLPNEGGIPSSPSLIGHEIWPLYTYTSNTTAYVRGEQNIVAPVLNWWDGLNGGIDMYQAIRDCNIFIDNIYSVPDMTMEEKQRWEAEVKFLKAYYHFLLMRMYGPIPIIRENLPIDAGLDEVRVSREPVDVGFNYIVQLLDEAIPHLPLIITDEGMELGRITRPIAMSIKAQVLVTAASPLFNGNSDYSTYIDKINGALFNPEFDNEKWRLAMEAAKAAIDICHEADLKLYKFQPGAGQRLSDTTVTQMSIRNVVAERWNSEIIWTWTGATATQTALTPRTWDPERSHDGMQGRYGPPLSFVSLFYTDNGVPIEEDKEWDYNGRFDLKVAGEADKYNIKQGYTTAKFHFNRENRFYASTGFDGGIWYGQGKFDDNDTWHLEGKEGQYTARQISNRYSPTGYWPKKLINYLNVIGVSSYSVVAYYWPNMRLADLYLLYAEAANEYLGPNDETFKYLDLVRERAGLPAVEDAWTMYSRNPTKIETKEGLREIIHRERRIELAYESKSLWDLLRWKKAQEELSKPVTGWDLFQPEAEYYYRETFIFERGFRQRDYFQPIREYNIVRNRNLLQSPGW
ncbi:Starch-binding associating with outer membrane [Parapedobacter composti]|uniref:Starch-binding associating with outer membrane n=1 Tax=Parapedobacter composti TaxID=623281 RepID=A0A1I1KA82_9SPHI|nr:RagB/SusD family nutrient uptake outer membrane protein [Parapedobacter composti]SFC55003.1 Starch-binding associating with outer membrane [Parapedobacter composti]